MCQSESRHSHRRRRWKSPTSEVGSRRVIHLLISRDDGRVYVRGLYGPTPPRCLYISSLTQPLQVTSATIIGMLRLPHLTASAIGAIYQTQTRNRYLYNAVTFNGATDGACERLLANHPHLSRTTPTNRQRDGWGGGRLSFDWLTLDHHSLHARVPGHCALIPVAPPRLAPHAPA